MLLVIYEQKKFILIVKFDSKTSLFEINAFY